MILLLRTRTVVSKFICFIFASFCRYRTTKYWQSSQRPPSVTSVYPCEAEESASFSNSEQDKSQDFSGQVSSKVSSCRECSADTEITVTVGQHRNSSISDREHVRPYKSNPNPLKFCFQISCWLGFLKVLQQIFVQCYNFLSGKSSQNRDRNSYVVNNYSEIYKKIRCILFYPGLRSTLDVSENFF